MSTSPVVPTSPTGGTSSTTQNGLPSAPSLNNMFLQLLVAQLQNQDPTAPLDPSQFVGQLAQFSELSEVTSIYQLLQQEAPATTGSGSGSTGTGSGGGTPPATGNAIAAMGSVPASASAILPGIASAPAGVSNFSSPNLSALTSQIQGVF